MNTVVERIEESFKNGEDFNFMKSDIQELKDLVEKVERYERTLKDISVNCTSEIFKVVAKMALEEK